jgi:hypothetical protein
MNDSTLKRLALIALFALAACSSSDTSNSGAEVSPDPSGWRLASGKAPTKAEFTALAATCQDKGGAFESCLVNLGLKRTP